MPRVLAVLLVVTLAFAVVGGVGYVVVSQVQALLVDLPNHKDKIAEKLVHIREAGKGSWIERLNSLIRDVEEQVKQVQAEQVDQPQPRADADKPQPMPVRLESSIMPILQSVAGSAVEMLVSAVLVLVLVSFMLIKREDLRNRLMRLWGHGGLTSMTRALDDATTRISRFLLMQLLVNSCFGVCVAVGLSLIGIPYAVLWGFLGACLRYIPYVGAWVSAVFPLVLSIAVKDGWIAPLEVLGLFLVLELVISNVVEPWLFGRSIGVSEIALLIAAAFWTWLWGPFGLVLSTPLTACLAVMGKYIPNLEFVGILLGDEPVLEVYAAYYQRLLARDQDEAADLIEEYARDHNSEEVFDSILVPALSLARRNFERGLLSRNEVEFIHHATAELLEEPWLPQAMAHPSEDAPAEEVPAEDQITVFGCPAHDELDELTLEMLHHLLDPARCRFQVLSPDALTAEVLTKVRAEEAAVVCIGTLPPQSLAHTRYLCKRLRSRFPKLKIIVGCWGWDGERAKIDRRLKDAGADQITTSLLETRSLLEPMVQVLQHTDGMVA